MYVRISIYLFSILCLCCLDMAFCTPFENRPKISSKNDFQLYKVILMFSSRNITFKSNHQWRLLDGIPKISVEETVTIDSNLTYGIHNAKNENLKTNSCNSTKYFDQKKESESKSTKARDHLDITYRCFGTFLNHLPTYHVMTFSKPLTHLNGLM